MAGQVWKLNGRRGIAYVEGKEAAEKILALLAQDEAGVKKLPDAAMAEYRDKKGRAFAWQIPFDLSRWSVVAGAMGVREPSPS